MRKKTYAKLLFFCIACFLSFPLFSVGGNIFHGKKVSVIKTNYFDILFSDDCLVTAKKIAAVADGYYVEISERLGVQPYQRFPVVITREVESPNGFFSPAPYNTIVLYESVLGNPLDAFTNEIESVFYHELTHAVTLNDKSAFWRGMSFFGDFMNPAYLSASYFWMEGASVLFESTISSVDGEGRLNNPYFTQMVSQAKADSVFKKKKFPSWRDVAGCRDIFPASGTRYAFGACFAKFLIEKYGTETYQAFWRRCGTYTTLSFIAGIFKKTYGTTMDKAWSAFIDCVPIVLDGASARERTLVSSSWATVKALDSFFDAKKGTRKTVWFDSRSAAVMENEGGISRKLFSATGVTRLLFSDDGKKIAVTRIVARKTPKSEVGVYDCERNVYRVVQKSGAAEAFFRDGACEFLDIASQIDSNVVTHWPLCVRLGTGESVEACIEKNGFDWSIVVGENRYSIGKRRIIDSLHLESVGENDISFCFTWAQADGLSSVSKIGRLVVDTNDFSATAFLQKTTEFSPFIDVVPSASPKDTLRFFAVAAEYEANPLYELSFSDEDFERLALGAGLPAVAHEQEVAAAEASYAAFSVEPYSSFSYALKGMKFPVGIVPVVNSDFEMKGLAFLGASYVIASPWLNNFFLASGGFDPINKDGGFLLGLYGFDSSINYRLFGTMLFNSGGFMQTYENYSLSKYLFRGLVSSVQTGISGDFFYGKELERDITLTYTSWSNDRSRRESYSFASDVQGLFSKMQVFLTFSNTHKTGPGASEVAGISFRPFIDWVYSNYKIVYDSWRLSDTPTLEKKYVNVGGTFKLYVPGLTIGNRSGIFPVILQATVSPSDEYFFSTHTSVTLFSWEIQKGIPALSLFATRAVLFASYTNYFSYLGNDEYFGIRRTFELFGDFSSNQYSDKVTVGVNVVLNPNTGALADPTLQFVLGTYFNYHPNPVDDKKWSIDVAFSILDFSRSKRFK